jgi:hypothetical protein
MGEAKRRKLIDPEYGKRFDKFKKDDSSHRFKISLQSKVIDSWVTVHVIDTIQTREAILPFHLYTIGAKAYAEAGIQREDMDEYRWVADHIDTLSPMICQLVLSDVRLLLVNPQR